MNIQIPIPEGFLEGDLTLVEGSSGLVIFAHGSGSSRLSPRNRYVANQLNKAGLSTLLFDLLTADEEVIDLKTREYRFNIPMLAQRLVHSTDWVLQQDHLSHFNLGYYGSSTGAAAALIAAEQRDNVVKAVVSRGGRPDLAENSLPNVNAPTLLIVGALDTVVIDLNEQAQSQMNNVNQLTLVPGATHLFEEPGKLDEVTNLAIDWFNQYL